MSTKRTTIHTVFLLWLIIGLTLCGASEIAAGAIGMFIHLDGARVPNVALGYACIGIALIIWRTEAQR